MAFGPITSWQIGGETMEAVTNFIFLGFKIITDSDCSHEIKTLAPWKENCDQPRQHIKKHRHYFANKVHLVKAMVFPVVIYGRESWTIKKAECERMDVFELWCWRRLPRIPWTARRWTQSILNEILIYILFWRRRGWQRMRWLDSTTDSIDMCLVISRSWWWTQKPGLLQSMGSQRVRHDWATELNGKERSPEYSLEELMLKLKFQYFGQLMWITDSLEKTLILGKTEGRRKRGWQRMSWLDDISD